MNTMKPPPPPASRGVPVWVWTVLGGCGLLVLIGAIFFGWLLFAAADGPNTDVYIGNEVPNSFRDILREIGALGTDERIDYFYSDALGDIRDSYYFVSDRRVVIFLGETQSAPTFVSFADIADVRLDRDESFFVDSQVTLELKDGTMIGFPLSSEHEGDVQFVDTIRKRIGQTP